MNFKKYVVFFALVLAVIYMFSLQNKKTGTYTGSSIAEGNYCLAIRGNGELEPAHWGGISKLIETQGLPSAMAGGSSASITMFLINAVAQNPFLQNDTVDAAEKNRRASLMVKSFLGFFTELKNTKFSQDIFKLYGEYNKLQALASTQSMATELVKKNFSEVINILNEGVKSDLFNHASLYPYFAALARHDEKSSQFFLKQLTDSITLFGKFDASTDANLFFRPGIINFKNASETFGRWAEFYAAERASEQVLNEWAQFFKQCSSESENLTWSALTKAKPECANLLHGLFESHFKNEPTVHLENREIGKPIAVYPSTSVLIGSAAGQVTNAFTAYDRNLDPEFGNKFKIASPEEVMFGYWGANDKLALIGKNLDPKNEKNRRFFSLGMTTWKEVLSLSPAEPGLSPLLPFTAKKQKLISAGGWSDLHPVDVLKASGCKNVVYLTRQGGESLFAQGVANRLLNLDRNLKATTPEQNNIGDKEADPNGVWSKLFNLANPDSSFNRALKNADAVMCTNWNAYDVQKDLVGLIENAYQSPFAVTENPLQLAPLLTDLRAGCQPRL